jgi:hypothetical protein
MSSDDPYDLRAPRRPVRIAILIAAIACLGLTMCVRSEQKHAPAKPSPPAQAAPQQAPNTPAQQQTPAKPERDPRYFNATKAPGGMY